MTGPLVELVDIVKVFPGVRANDGISFTVETGEVHGLLGENGAGKSTLMSVLYGLYQPDGGHIVIDGQPVVLRSPKIALRHGIAIVQQHFSLVPTLTVAENVVLGHEGGRWFRPARIRAMVAELCARYGVDIDPAALVRDLSIGQRQRVEILKCLFRDPRVIVLDEPTTVLTPPEVGALFATARRLASEGRGVVLITHKLDELMAVTDRITVLRNGKSVATVRTAEVDPPELARTMVGRDVRLRSAVGLDTTPVAAAGPSRPDGAVRLRLDGVGLRDEGGVDRLRAIDLEVKAGEVLGVAGVEGNGQRELVGLLCGTTVASAGGIWVDGAELTTAGVRGLRRAGVRVVTEDRHATGLVLDMTVGENLVCDRVDRAPLSRAGVLSRREMQRQAGELIGSFGVRTPGPDTTMRALSGGNQQRAILARELSGEVTVLVAAQPTRGLDVGAIEEVTDRILTARDGGTAVLLISSDLTEVLALSDRVAVLHRGELVATLDRADATLDVVGPLMAGLETMPS